MILIYSNHITARLQYITQTLFGEQFALTASKEKFLEHSGTKINYSSQSIDSTAFQITPHSLLFETEIKQQEINCFNWDGLKVFFKTTGDIPFDIFAASFYLLSRYEEYLPHQKDEYGRYAHSNSLAYKESFLKLPLVNLWLREFNIQYSIFNIQYSAFKFIPTYDIDIAFAYRHQPLWLNVFGFYRDLFVGNFEKVIERGNVYSGNKKDPFDVYDWLNELHERHQLNPLYFFLVAQKRKGVDKNISPRKKAMQDLIQQHAKKCEVGIHPSWQSRDEESRESGVGSQELKKEISFLKNIVQHTVTKSRQHYLRFTIPQTFRRLIDAGIADEYSMGYGTINGFRASYTLPFYWFDLEKNETTNLLLHPFCFMDANSIFEQKYSVEQTAKELQHYFDVVKKVNGELITLFHNHFLTEQEQWIAWRKMYEDFLKNCH
ncbi:hypothetical protein GALL_94720 [mine drainage metagenome]|uniref:DUF7033 domain-containing protein n=1 Tax=mine drainage metagenome TaxID=410659 RepID=A0A1J5SW70_9ZZZZ